MPASYGEFDEWQRSDDRRVEEEHTRITMLAERPTRARSAGEPPHSPCDPVGEPQRLQCRPGTHDRRPVGRTGG